MVNEAQILARITKSAESLSRAARRVILDMIRRGATLKEIQDALRGMSLPSKEMNQLDKVVRDSMKELDAARAQLAKAAGLPELPGNNVTSIMAASKLSVPKIRSDVRKSLRASVLSAIAREVGPDVLARELKDKQIGNGQTLANTSIAAFNNLYTFEQASEIGVNKFLYSGPGGPEIRKFCREHLGKKYTLQQIELMDNGQGLPVKENCGGYNCRHEWVMVV